MPWDAESHFLWEKNVRKCAFSSYGHNSLISVFKDNLLFVGFSELYLEWLHFYLRHSVDYNFDQVAYLADLL